MKDLPPSGEPGATPPVPGSLPRPVMWAPGTSATPFRGAQEDTATPATPGRRRAAWAGVAGMVLGLVLFALGIVTGDWPFFVAAVVVGGSGAVVAIRAGIMEDVSVSDSPHGSG